MLQSDRRADAVDVDVFTVDIKRRGCDRTDLRKVRKVPRTIRDEPRYFDGKFSGSTFSFPALSLSLFNLFHFNSLRT